MKRREFLYTAFSAAVLTAPARAATAQIQVLKSPTCGCCGAWVTHIEDAGFVVDVQDVAQDVLWSVKDRAGITAELSSCHTGLIDGYVIEGHVPAADIQRHCQTKPA